MSNVFESAAAKLVLTNFAKKIEELKPTDLLGAFGSAVEAEVAELKTTDSDKNGVMDFTDVETEVAKIKTSGERIVQLLEASHAAIAAK